MELNAKGTGVEGSDGETQSKGAKKGHFDPGVTVSDSPVVEIVVGVVSQALRVQ